MNYRNPKLAKLVDSEITRLTVQADQLQHSAEAIHQALAQYQRQANQLIDKKYHDISQVQVKINALNKLQRSQKKQVPPAQSKTAPVVVTAHKEEAPLETALMRAGNLMDLSKPMDIGSVVTK